MAPVAERLRARIRDASCTSPDSETFRQEVLDALHAYVPFDATCLGGTDPYVLVPTSLTTQGYDDLRAYAVALDVEYGESEEPGSFESMVRGRIPVRTLRETADDRPTATRRYAELLAPYGLNEEIRMVIAVALSKNCDGLVETFLGFGEISAVSVHYGKILHRHRDVGMIRAEPLAIDPGRLR